VLGVTSGRSDEALGRHGEGNASSDNILHRATLSPTKRGTMAPIDRLKEHARTLKRDTMTLYYAARHPRTPWYAKVLAVCVVTYALSPFDLIPDFIPILGYLDDLILVPAGIALVLRLVPPDVMAECRAQAAERAQKPTSYVGAALMVAIWLLILIWVGITVYDTRN
jgi:uncharacterized membrane protein YkvA (DUF1232 family)